MIALILFIAFGLLFGYFATRNTDLVSVYFGTTSVENVPLYIVILATLGLGIFFTSLFYWVKSLSSQFAIGKKQKDLISAQKEIADLVDKNHKLELALTRLRTETEKKPIDKD